ncbi:MAG: AsmA family protein [Burkholderiales bacterium]
MDIPLDRRRSFVLGGALGIVAAALLVALWDWNWFKPVVEQRASEALGRQVRIANLNVHVSRQPALVADGVEIDNPAAFPDGSRFASVEQLWVQVEPGALLRRAVVLPLVVIRHPRGELLAPAQGVPNWTLPATGGSDAWHVDIGELVIEGGSAHLSHDGYAADVDVTFVTETDEDSGKPELRVAAKGTYAGQPITAQLRGGAVLTLRDEHDPYPIALDLRNGATRLQLDGTLLDPLRFGGANISLDLKGNTLAALYPLTGVPLPDTPGYRLQGKLDYADRAFRFKDFSGRVGSSDLSGTVTVDPHGERFRVTADVRSDNVVLADLAGFIGGTPQGTRMVQSPTSAQPKAGTGLLPDTPIDVPKLQSADVDARYAAKRIEGGRTPLDNVAAHMTIDNGRIRVQPLAFGVGRGSIASTIMLDGNVTPAHVQAKVDFRDVDFGHVVDKTSEFSGQGRIAGAGHIDTRGSSFAQMAANANGELKLFMSGGEVSALVVDLAGLDFGNAALSALGIPEHARVHCMVTDLGIRNGQIDTRVFLFDTSEANVIGRGSVDLKRETIDYRFSTEPKHFSIGSLPAPIKVTGMLQKPTVRPDVAALGIRGGVAAVLGIVATPLAALIPTIQLGLGSDNDCGDLLRTVQAAAKQQRGRAERQG